MCVWGSRRTDFYVVADPNQPAPMGFPPGIAKNILLKSCDKYEFKDYKDTKHCKTSNTNSPAVSERMAPSVPETNIPTVTPVGTDKKHGGKQSKAISTQLEEIVSTPGPQFPIGNGGLGLGYYWTQTLKEVTIHIDLEAG